MNCDESTDSTANVAESLIRYDKPNDNGGKMKKAPIDASADGTMIRDNVSNCTWNCSGCDDRLLSIELVDAVRIVFRELGSKSLLLLLAIKIVLCR